MCIIMIHGAVDYGGYLYKINTSTNISSHKTHVHAKEVRKHICAFCTVTH